MRWLPIIPRPGMKARVHYVAPYDLPDELEKGDDIAVTNSASRASVVIWHLEEWFVGAFSPPG